MKLIMTNCTPGPENYFQYDAVLKGSLGGVHKNIIIAFDCVGIIFYYFRWFIGTDRMRI